MPLVAWTAKLETGIASIDGQHRKLVDTINILHEAMKTGKGKDKAGEVTDFLLSYTKEHFAFEEKLLADAGYPALTQHREDHNRLIGQVEDLVQRRQGNRLLTIELSDFLGKWITGHIQGRDLSYVPHLKAKGVA